MAHKSKKKPAAPAALKPEKYIQQKGRSLPVYKCYINHQWQEGGFAVIAVCRQMPSGNLIAGCYLVDTFCLGLKDTLFFFNEPVILWKETLSDTIYEEMEWEECDYVLAHNIVYGSIAYAEELGLKPDKDFAITRFLLEEDTEEVELMEVEFGKDGKPFYIPGPNDDADFVIGRLITAVGIDNFVVDTDWLNEKEGEDWEEEEYREPEIIDGMLVTFNAKKIEGFDSCVQVLGGPDEFEKLHRNILENPVLAAARLDTLIKKFPEHPIFYNLLYMVALITQNADLAENTARKMYTEFEGNLDAMLNYARISFRNNDLDTIKALLNDKYSLKEHYPDRNEFHYSDVTSFWAVVAEYLIKTGTPARAIPYMDKIRLLDTDNELISHLEDVLREVLEEG